MHAVMSSHDIQVRRRQGEGQVERLYPYPAPTEQDCQDDAKAVCPIMFATKDEVLQLY